MNKFDEQAEVMKTKLRHSFSKVSSDISRSLESAFNSPEAKRALKELSDAVGQIQIDNKAWQDYRAALKRARLQATESKKAG
jgi:hypothetical protein